MSVSKDETERLFRRYRAHLSNPERIENGRLASVYVDVPDTYGPTVSEAMRALDASFEMWQLDNPIDGGSHAAGPKIHTTTATKTANTTSPSPMTKTEYPRIVRRSSGL